jgi:hypothetical protein
LEVAEFKRILDIGLGRAILYLQTHDAAPHREVILNACLHNTAFEPLTEGTRARYLYDVIHLTDEVPFYRKQLLKALMHSSPTRHNWDGQHLFDFATLFALKGDKGAHRAITERFDLNATTGHTLGAQHMISLKGIAGFGHVASHLGDIEPAEDNYVSYSDVIERIERMYGKEKSQFVFDRFSADSRMSAFIATAQKDRDQQRQARNKRNPKELTYAEFKQWIADELIPTKNYTTSSCMVWGVHASESDLASAANDLLALNDLDYLHAYLRVFDKCPFPLDPSKLIDIAIRESDEPLYDANGWLSQYGQVIKSALYALSNLTDQAVRNFALKLIDDPDKSGWAANLLLNNWHDDDWQLLTELTTRNYNPEDCHHLTSSVLNIFKVHPSSNAVQSLINLYETNPCSFCRKYLVEHLRELESLPDYMLEECKHDANFKLRQLTQNNFKQPEK